MPRTIRIEPTEPARPWLGAKAAFPVRNRDTGGRISVQRSELPPGFANPPHCHGLEDEVFFVESGRVIAGTPDGDHELGPGDLIYLPRGLAHQLRGTHAEPATILTLLSPGVLEEAFLACIDGGADLAHEMGVYGVRVLDTLEHHDHPLAPDPDEPTIVRAHEGDAYWLAGDEYRIMIPSERVGDRFCVVRFLVPPGAGPAPHVHRRDEEIFHILEGEASFYADGDTVLGRAGQTVILPRGVPHAFRNTSGHAASFLAVTTPGGFDRFVRECARPATPGVAPPRPDADELARIQDAAPRYGVEIIADTEWDPEAS